MKSRKSDHASLPGFEPGTFGLEVQRAIHCATGTDILFDFYHKYLAYIWDAETSYPI